MTVRPTEKLDQAIENYGQTAKSASTGKIGKVALAGFGAAAAGGLFTASEADAGIVYSGILNIGFVVSTVNASSTNAISPPFIFNSLTGGAPMFGIAGNNRGPNNPVGSTDILWAVGAGYPLAGGFGGVFANGPSFPTTVVAQNYSSVIPGQGTPASLAWAAAGNPGFMQIDPFGVGSTGSVTGYFGFSFRTTAAANPNFGWARVNITSAGGQPTSMTLIDYAYENTGAPIHVGTIPEPSAAGMIGLCALAAGAAGIRRRRKEKAQAS